jgi:hypothetical protein
MLQLRKHSTIIKSIVLPSVFFLLILIAATSVLLFKTSSSSRYPEENALSTTFPSTTPTKPVKNLDALQKELSNFLDKYEMTLFHDKTNSYTYFSYEEPTEEDFTRYTTYAEVFMEEWGKYPKNWPSKANVKAIYFVKNLKVGQQSRSAMPEEYDGALYFDLNYIYDKQYVRQAIHHEFYHLIELHFQGDYYYKDPKWAKLNTSGFKYIGKGSDSYDDPNYVHKEHPQSGFVTSYSTYGLEEDKAEVYSYLMTSKTYENLQDWIKDDKYLKAKVDYMINFTKSKVPEMDEAFYAKVNL